MMSFGMLPFERGSDNLFDTFDSFARDFFRSSNTSLPAFRTDIRDDGDKFVLEAELPGFDKSDISLDVKEGILTITAKHQEKEEHKEEKGGYIRRERRFGSFSRSFDITGIDEGGITAAYVNGILELRLPKAVPVIPEARRIAIE
ncbi:MAG: Hsp20/alpha crystallin family protein [Flavonifractor sp.]|nr:Hsp20/alpha crystallin family protein [Flavonifractor sp.]